MPQADLPARLPARCGAALPERRRLLTGGAALAAAAATGALLPGCAATGSPSAGGGGGGTDAVGPPTRVAPGVTRLPLGGGVTVHALSDGSGARPLSEGFVRDVPLAQVRAALAEAGLPTDAISISYTAFLVDAAGHRVLLDSGNGQFGAPGSGQLASSLAAAGVDPRSIDAVLITHFHGDHINGLRDRAGQLVFPNARIFVPAPEWDFWMDDARLNAAPEGLRAGFATVRRVFGTTGAGQVERFAPGSEIVPGVLSMPAYGHTPGHTAFMVRTPGRRFVYWGDLTNIAALFVRNPDWAIQFDMDAQAARATRRRLLEQAVAEDWTVAGYHLQYPAAGRIVRRGQGYDFVPVPA